MNIKVSVCIPVYGVEKYIERCARSLFEQTMQDGLELIFVNDCTPDRSIEILERVLMEYPHRKDHTIIIHHAQNKGLVAARKTGLAYASGEYIIHCDPDDWVELDMYETMYKAAKDADADMVYCDYAKEMPDKSLHKSGGTSLTAIGLQTEMMGRETLGTLWNRLYRNQIAQADYIDVCPDDVVFCEDLLRNMFMLKKVEKIIKIPMFLYHYRNNPLSISETKGVFLAKNAFASQFIIEKHFQDKKYQFSIECRRRYVLFLAIQFNVVSIWEYYKLCKTTKLNMWRDRHFSCLAKCLFYLACMNFTAASYIYRKMKGF